MQLQHRPQDVLGIATLGCSLEGSEMGSADPLCKQGSLATAVPADRNYYEVVNYAEELGWLLIAILYPLKSKDVGTRNIYLLDISYPNNGVYVM